MLSVTNSVNDIISKTVGQFTEYGFSTQLAFTTAIENSINETKLQKLIPAIGEDLYNYIAAKDKVGLTLDQERIYWAEVYLSLWNFLYIIANKETQRKAGANVSSNRSGSSASSSGDPGKYTSAMSNYIVGMNFLANAGYSLRLVYASGAMVEEWICENKETYFMSDIK